MKYLVCLLIILPGYSYSFDLREPRDPENASSSQQVFISQQIQPNSAIPVPRDIFVRNILLSGQLNNQPTKVLYVDQNSTALNPNGSFYNPFVRIQDAINAIIKNQDNNTYQYRIEVAPGTYPENLTFNNQYLYSVALFGHDLATIQVSSGSLLNCTTNNTQLNNLIFDSFTLNATGGTGIVYSASTSFFNGSIGAQFSNCAINGNLSLTNVGSCSIMSSLCTGTINLTNVSQFDFVGGNGQIGADLNVVTSTVFYQSTSFMQGAVTTDATSFIQVQNSLFTDAFSSITNNGRIDAYASYLAATNIINNGFLNLFGSFYSHGVISGSGTIITKTPSELVDYAATATVWAAPAPTNVYTALNRIAAQLAAQFGPIP